LNSNYEILEQLLRLDIEAGLATANQRKAQRQLAELAKKTKDIEERTQRIRNDMRLKEGDMLRKYKRIDEIEEMRTEKSARLFAAKTDDEHRNLKREVDNLEKEVRDNSRYCTETEELIERAKDMLSRDDAELNKTLAASADERQKAQDAENESSGRLSELAGVRDTYVARLDNRLQQHYRRVAKVTRNPDGPVARIVNNACGNCHMGISPQLMNSLRTGREVEFCPNCHHILLPETK
jgi:predicted  nucleic acid-binding Zn-ribbon protein